MRNVSENISRTIGLEYELLVWDNRQEKMGLCAVYNRMAARAKFPYLFFLHEDILFETESWGRTLVRLFEDHPRMGAIGIAGSSYKSARFSGWYNAIEDLDYYNITHRTNGVDHKWKKKILQPAPLHRVVTIDGVLMACRKEVWATVRFGEELLKGFHFYDIDFSLRVAKDHEVGVTLDIDLVHVTLGGDYGDRWVDAAIHWHEKYTGPLPSFVDNASSPVDPSPHTSDPLPYAMDDKPPDTASLDRTIVKSWLDRLKNEPISLRNRIRWVRGQQLEKQLLSLFYPLLRFFIFRLLGLARVRRLFTANRTAK